MENFLPKSIIKRRNSSNNETSTQYDNLIKSIEILNSSKIEHEVRTTVRTSLLDESDIKEISSVLKDMNFRGTFYIQNFINREKTLAPLPAQQILLDINNLNLDVKADFRNF